MMSCARTLLWAVRPDAGRRDQNALFRLKIGITDVDLHQEAVELRFGKRIGAFLFQRVLGRQT